MKLEIYFYKVADLTSWTSNSVDSRATE